MPRRGPTWSSQASSLLEIDIEALGLDEQIQKLDRFDEIAGKHIRPVIARGIAELVSGWRGIVPSVSGQYMGSIVGRVEQVYGVSVTAVGSTDVLAANRYPYPFMLESSRRFPKTYHKILRMLRGMRPRLEAHFAEAVGRIVDELAVRK